RWGWARSTTPASVSWRAGGGAARPAPGAAPAGACGRADRPPDRDFLQPCAHGARPLDAAPVCQQGPRTRLCTQHRAPDDPTSTKKRSSTPGSVSGGACRAWGAPFVAAREEVLDLYAQPPAPQQPLVCFDEKPIVLHPPTRPSLPPSPGHPARSDYAYE